MLSALDETLMHQGPTTFDHALTTDHRFFDRTVTGVYSPDGSLAVLIGFAVYKNMNVMEGFALVQHEGREQINYRFSRALRPSLVTNRIGPMAFDIVEPFKHLKLTFQDDAQYRIAFDLDWTSSFPAHEEGHHFGRLDGRAVRDHCRFGQLGQGSGSITVDGKQTSLSNWFGWRDHSWGVRPGVGGFEPFTGSHERDPNAGFMLIWLVWSTGTMCGALQIQEDGNGNRLYLDGHVAFRDGSGRQGVHVREATHDLHFVPGTRVADHARFEIVAEDGSAWTIETEALGRPWVLKGGGYDRGFNDGRALGVWRGTAATEHDCYDVSHPEDVKLADGSIIRPPHREQPVRVIVNGEGGFGHFPLILAGGNTRYGLTAR